MKHKGVFSLVQILALKVGRWRPLVSYLSVGPLSCKWSLPDHSILSSLNCLLQHFFFKQSNYFGTAPLGRPVNWFLSEQGRWFQKKEMWVLTLDLD